MGGRRRGTTTSACPSSEGVAGLLRVAGMLSVPRVAKCGGEGCWAVVFMDKFDLWTGLMYENKGSVVLFLHQEPF